MKECIIIILLKVCTSLQYCAAASSVYTFTRCIVLLSGALSFNCTGQRTLQHGILTYVLGKENSFPIEHTEYKFANWCYHASDVIMGLCETGKLVKHVHL